MDYSIHKQDKLNSLKIEGQSRPFIDHDLQLQFPGAEDVDSASHLCCPVYSHFIGIQPSKLTMPSSINETDLNQAMEEAKKSYQAWNQLKNGLLKALNR